jgi:poly-gamma-glutamate capsule biosynthesis protein CapA/YwtB (metallophosphatase superfamily)
MIGAGIDLVVGSHAHVLNPAELVDGKLVAYSLGNFVSAFRELEVRTSAVLEITLVEGSDGRVTVGDFSFRPVFTRGENHTVHPIYAGAKSEAGRALRHAREILGEAAVKPFSQEG